MRTGKRSLLLLLLVYAVIVCVNLLVNYSSYKAGGNWKFSLSFSLIVATVGWLGYLLLYAGVFKSGLDWEKHPTRSLVIVVLSSGAYGVVIMMMAISALQLLGQIREVSFSKYANDCVYAALFTMLFGLIIHGQDFLIRLRRSIADNARIRLELLQSQHESLKAQVKPHFLFNAMNTLVTLIPEDPDKAVKFVRGLSQVLRYSLQQNAELTSLASELKIAEAFLFLNQQRFRDRLSVATRIDARSGEKSIVTHALLTLIENAIKHNEISAERPLAISIVATTDDTLVVSNTYQPVQSAHPSLGLGLPNIVDRYKFVTDRPVTVHKEDEFVVTIPLL